MKATAAEKRHHHPAGLHPAPHNGATGQCVSVFPTPNNPKGAATTAAVHNVAKSPCWSSWASSMICSTPKPEFLSLKSIPCKFFSSSVAAEAVSSLAVEQNRLNENVPSFVGVAIIQKTIFLRYNLHSNSEILGFHIGH